MRLTDEQRELAAKAMEIASVHLDRVATRNRQSEGVLRGVFHERIVGLIASFDPSKSSLKTWVHGQINYSILAASRVDWNHEGNGLRRVGRRRSVSIHRVSRDAVEFQVEPASHDQSQEELAEHLLHVLPVEQREIYRMYAAGYTMQEIADRCGKSISAIGKMFARHHDWLWERYRRMGGTLREAARHTA